MLDLKNFGVVELNAQEVQETEGGIFWFGLIILAICLVEAFREL